MTRRSRGFPAAQTCTSSSLPQESAQAFPAFSLSLHHISRHFHHFPQSVNMQSLNAPAWAASHCRVEHYFIPSFASSWILFLSKLTSRCSSDLVSGRLLTHRTLIDLHTILARLHAPSHLHYRISYPSFVCPCRAAFSETEVTQCGLIAPAGRCANLPGQGSFSAGRRDL